MVYNRFARSFLTTNGQNEDYYSSALQYAQQGLTLAEKINFPKGEADLHRTLGSACYFLNEHEKAIEHYEKALKICETLRDRDGMALNYFNLNLVYRRQLRYYYSLHNLQNALAIWNQLGNTKRMILVYKDIILVYQTVGELQLAENYAKEALRLSLETGSRQDEAALYEILAKNHSELGHHQEAEEYYQKTLQIYEELGDQMLIARTIHNIATFQFKENPETALDLFRKSAAIYENIPLSNNSLYIAYNNIANLFLEKKQEDSAYHYLRKALNKANLSENPQIMAEAYCTTGRFYLFTKDLPLAEKYYRQAYDIALKNGLTGTLSNTLSGLSSLNYEKGNYKTAFDYLQKYQVINDSLIREDNKANIRQLTMQNDYKKDEKEMEETIKAQLEQERQAFKYQQTVMVIILIALILTAILLVFLARSNRLKKVANRKLKTYKDNLEKMVDIKTLELTVAKEKAEESSRLKSAFLANMSHEIRTPLNGIIGFLRFIDSDDSPTRRKEYMKVINSSSEQLVKIIDDIMDISMIEANQMTVTPVPVQLNQLMDELVVFFRTYLEASQKEHIEFILDESSFIDQCLINVDTVRLRQIFNNLMSNAIKFTDKGYIRFGYHLLEKNMLEFFIEDTGIGIPENQMELIFERFHQVNLGNSRFYGGLGLGLSIARSLTQLMGGDISVKSTEGVGSTFSFTIAYNNC